MFITRLRPSCCKGQLFPSAHFPSCVPVAIPSPTLPGLRERSLASSGGTVFLTIHLHPQHKIYRTSSSYVENLCYQYTTTNPCFLVNIILKWTHKTSWLSISLYTRTQTTSKKHLPWTCVAGAFWHSTHVIGREFPASVTEIQHGRGLLSSTRKVKRFYIIIFFRLNKFQSVMMAMQFFEA